MYQYTNFDRQFIAARNTQFRQQVARRIDGSLTEEEFRPLRLMNGVYLQLHAYMLRVAIPYGTLSSAQMRQLAIIADKWDKGYGHFTTRQNIQFNWPRLIDVPDILDALAEVDLHAIQTSGNTIRNITSDHFAGATSDEVEDPRIISEIIRQWSTDHPEFQFLPRKFKIAVTGCATDRAVIKAHDIGLQATRRDGVIGYQVFVGGGLGRTPVIGKLLCDFLPKQDLLPYLESILSVYNTSGRRDNKYKARIKILVNALGIDNFRDQVEARFSSIRKTFASPDGSFIDNITSQFSPPDFTDRSVSPFEESYQTNPMFKQWVDRNTAQHKHEDYRIVTVSLKEPGQTPGDATSEQMQVLADLAESFSFDELRISHEQNIVLPHVHKADLPLLYNTLKKHRLATANIGLISDIIACPGMDYCSLATARSIPVAKEISTHFDENNMEQDTGEVKIKVSGCINACGHHHVAHIGVLGLNRAGVENYQITLGGDATENTAIGDRAGPGFSQSEVVPAIERILGTYHKLRHDAEESFINTYKRVGITPFKSALYPAAKQSR